MGEIAKAVIITHGEDVDGIISAGLLCRYLNEVINLSNLESILVSHKNFDNLFCKLARNSSALKGKRLFIADLALKDSLFVKKEGEGSVIEKIVQSCSSLYWLDHHKTSKQMDFESYGGNYISGSEQSKSASMLVYEECLAFRMGEEMVADDSEELALIAQCNDYPEIFSEHSCFKDGYELQRAISFANYRDDDIFLDNLVKSIGFYQNWRLMIDDYLVKHKSLLDFADAYLEKNQDIVLINDYFIFIFGVHPTLPQKETLRNLRGIYQGKVSAIVGIFFAPVLNALVFQGYDGKNFPVDDLCCRMNGGSRDGDGGFSLSGEVDWSDFKIAKKKMVEIIVNYFAV